MTALEAILLHALEFYAKPEFYDNGVMKDDAGRQARAVIEQHRKVRNA